MGNPSRKEIARALREAGNESAALAVLLDYAPTTGLGGDDDAAERGQQQEQALLTPGQQQARARGVLTVDELKAMPGKDMAAALDDPAKKAVIEESMRAAIRS